MKMIFLTLLIAVQGCTSSNESKAQLSKMRSCYESVVSFENSDFCFIQDEHAHLRQLTNKNKSLDFWTAFANYRLEVGARKANMAIKDLVKQFGSSTALFLPINSDLRGSKVDELVNSLLLADINPTKRLTERVGQPCDLVVVDKIRSGLLP